MAVSDLQRGERYLCMLLSCVNNKLFLTTLHCRYSNMDYLFLKSLIDSNLKCIYISYDIICQWSINLRKRMLALDHTFVIFKGNVCIKYLVPKFHLPAHALKCCSTFSFKYAVSVSRMDGEAPEQGWAKINPLAMSTKEMGPGLQRGVLDAHFSNYNWQKIMGMGKSILFV